MEKLVSELHHQLPITVLLGRANLPPFLLRGFLWFIFGKQTNKTKHCSNKTLAANTI